MIAEKTQHNTRHGGAYDRGSADSYYSRGHNPHYYVAGTSTSLRVDMEQMTPAELAAYTAGFNDNEQFGDKKDWN